MTAFLLTLLVLAAIGGLVAWISLIIAVFRQGEKGWGVTLIVTTFVPIVGTLIQLAFLWMRRRQHAEQIRIIVGCSVLAAVVSVPLQKRAASAVEEAMNIAAAESALANPEDSASEENTAETRAPSRAESSSEAAPTNATISATSITKNPPWPTRDDPRRSRPGTPKPTKAVARVEPTSTATLEVSTTATVTATNRASAEELFSPTPVPKADPSRAELTVLGLGEPAGEALRPLRLRLANSAKQPIRELKLQLEYLDAQGSRMGEWTTLHRGSDTVVNANATNEFELPAFFVPTFAKDVRVHLLRIRYADDTEWPHGY